VQGGVAVHDVQGVDFEVVYGEEVVEDFVCA
jgi:hypothetical protein